VVAGFMGAMSSTVGYLRDKTVLEPWYDWLLLEDELTAMPPLLQPMVSVEDGHEVILLD